MLKNKPTLAIRSVDTEENEPNDKFGGQFSAREPVALGSIAALEDTRQLAHYPV